MSPAGSIFDIELPNESPEGAEVFPVSISESEKISNNLLCLRGEDFGLPGDDELLLDVLEDDELNGVAVFGNGDNCSLPSGKPTCCFAVAKYESKLGPLLPGEISSCRPS